MQKLFSGGFHDSWNVRNGAHRTGQHSEPVHRQVLQSDGNVGQIPQRMVQDHASDLLPVSSCPDGRRTWSHVSGAAAEGNKKKYFQNELLKIRFYYDLRIKLSFKTARTSHPLRAPFPYTAGLQTSEKEASVPDVPYDL